MKRWIIVITVVVLLAGGFVAIHKFSGRADEPVFRTQQIEKGTIKKIVSGTGNIEYTSTYRLITHGEGIINELSLKNKQTVKTGQELYRLNGNAVFALNGPIPFYRALRSGDEGDDVKVLQSSLKEMGYDIDEDDGEFGSRTRSELLQFQEDKEISETGRLDPQILQAFPLPLQVADLKVKQGDRVTPGQEIAVLAPSRKFKADILMNEIDVPLLKVGGKASITIDALPGEEFSGKVTSISDVAASSTDGQQSTGQSSSGSSGVVNYSVEILLDDSSEKLKPGMTANADIVIKEKADTLLVPIEAIMERGDHKFVRLLEGKNRVPLAPVETGISSDNETEITSGVDEGETVILGTLAEDPAASGQRPGGGFMMRAPGGGRPGGGAGGPGGGGPGQGGPGGRPGGGGRGGFLFNH